MGVPIAGLSDINLFSWIAQKINQRPADNFVSFSDDLRYQNMQDNK
jgi:hypothetical protein